MASSQAANKPIMVANGVPKLHLINGTGEGEKKKVNGVYKNGYAEKEAMNGSLTEVDPEMEAEKDYALQHPQESVAISPAPMPTAGDLESAPKVYPGVVRRGKSFEGGCLLTTIVRDTRFGLVMHAHD